MDGHGDQALRVGGVAAGIGAMLPVGLLAVLAITSAPVGYFAGVPIRLPLQLGVVLGGVTLALLIATIAVADGQAWGAVVIALYGAGIALLIHGTHRRDPGPVSGDATIVALHAAIAVFALVVAFGLIRHTGSPSP